MSGEQDGPMPWPSADAAPYEGGCEVAAAVECGSEPPRILIDERGREWQAGDCWCTQAEKHDGLCACGPCTRRFGAPGWVKP